MVPLAGLEPARPYGQQILNLPRLPIPPQGHDAREPRVKRRHDRQDGAEVKGKERLIDRNLRPCYHGSHVAQLI